MDKAVHLIGYASYPAVPGHFYVEGARLCGSHFYVEGARLCGSHFYVEGARLCGSHFCLEGARLCGSHFYVEGARLCGCVSVNMSLMSLNMRLKCFDHSVLTNCVMDIDFDNITIRLRSGY